MYFKCCKHIFMTQPYIFPWTNSPNNNIKSVRSLGGDIQEAAGVGKYCHIIRCCCYLYRGVNTRIQLALESRLEEERVRLKKLQDEQFKAQQELETSPDHFSISAAKIRHHSNVRWTSQTEFQLTRCKFCVYYNVFITVIHFQ